MNSGSQATWRSAVDVLRARADQAPDKPSLHFISPDDEVEAVSYGGLEARARAVAGALQARGLQGRPVLLLYPPGMDYIVAFWGCLVAGAVAVPAYPPDLAQMRRTFSRLQAIMRDSGCSAVLTTSTLHALAESFGEAAPILEGMDWVLTDAVEPGLPWSDPGLGPDSLALIQYTSGSTGDPKGVVLTHGNLLGNRDHISPIFDLPRNNRVLLWLPPYHDMGLYGGVVMPVLADFTAWHISPLDFLVHPFRWLELITRLQITNSGGPNFAYDLAARKVTEEQKQSLDLSSWRVAFCGAEPVRAETLRRFADTFAPRGFRYEAFLPCYGLAEATLFVTGKPAATAPVARAFARQALARGLARPDEHGDRFVSSGLTQEDPVVRVVNPETLEVLPEGSVGEVWVSGPNVALGYWGRPEESEATFRARLPGEPGRAFLRTGDLGFLAEGELFIAGRIKDTIILRGVNLYPQDIERVVESAHPALRPGCSAAFPVDGPDGERLGVAVETKRGADPSVVIPAIEAALGAELGLTPHLVALLEERTIPKTSSGKIRRRACKEELLSGALVPQHRYEAPVEAVPAPPARAEAPSTPVALSPEVLRAMEDAAREAALRAVVLDALREVQPDAVELPDPDADLRVVGLDSVMVVDVLSGVETRTGLVLPMEDLARGVTLRQLLRSLSEEAARAADA